LAVEKDVLNLYGGGRSMKYILFGEGRLARGELPLRADSEVSRETAELRKDEEKYGKVILPAHYYSTGKSVAVVEFDNARQLANRLALGALGVTYTKAYPLIPGEDYGAANREHRELQERRWKALKAI